MKDRAIIFGKGFVGEATARAFDLDVEWHDPHKGLGAKDWSAPYAFICVPTPGDQFGLDTSAVSECLRHLRVNKYEGTIVIRSTCPPGALQAFAKLYGDVIYFPEFLRERFAFYDALHPHLVVMGGNKTRPFELWLRKKNHGGTAKWFVTDIQTAGSIKLGLNTALAAKVALFNALHEFAETSHADWSVMSDAIASDWRIGHGQTEVPGPDGLPGFGGKCLPKDLNAVAKTTQNQVLTAVLQYNNTLRKPN